MSIEEEVDKPLVLSNQPRFSSIGRNRFSIVGRFLNPENQKMSDWIWDMPRVWRLYDRVCGVALSKEKFQFIFKNEADMIEVLKTGVWTQNDWGVVMERWIEEPPDDYLMFLPVWIRLRNIPINYYTKDTINKIAEEVGQVIELAFDPEKSQSRDYVRLRVLFDVRRRLRNSKAVQLPTGDIVSIGIDYERVRKRCHQCQRLTHDKIRCPLNSLKTQNSAMEGIKKASPLVQDISEKKAKEIRIQSPIKDIEENTMAQENFLHLEDDSVVSSDLEKQNGSVFQFEGKNVNDKKPEKLLEDEMKTGFSSCCSESSFYERSSKRENTQQRHKSWKRKKHKFQKGNGVEVVEALEEESIVSASKRKMGEENFVVAKILKRQQNSVVPDKEPLPSQ